MPTALPLPLLVAVADEWEPAVALPAPTEAVFADVAWLLAEPAPPTLAAPPAPLLDEAPPPVPVPPLAPLPLLF